MADVIRASPLGPKALEGVAQLRQQHVQLRGQGLFAVNHHGFEQLHTPQPRRRPPVGQFPHQRLQKAPATAAHVEARPQPRPPCSVERRR